MLDKVLSIFVTALIVTAIGIALRPGAPTAAIVNAWMKGFAGIQRAAYGS